MGAQTRHFPRSADHHAQCVAEARPQHHLDAGHVEQRQPRLGPWQRQDYLLPAASGLPRRARLCNGRPAITTHDATSERPLCGRDCDRRRVLGRHSSTGTAGRGVRRSDRFHRRRNRTGTSRWRSSVHRSRCRYQVLLGNRGGDAAGHQSRPGLGRAPGLADPRPGVSFGRHSGLAVVTDADPFARTGSGRDRQTDRDAPRLAGSRCGSAPPPPASGN